MKDLNLIFSIIGLALALGEIRNHEWFRRLESFLDSIPNKKAWSSEKHKDGWLTIFGHLGEIAFLALVVVGYVGYQSVGISLLLYADLPLLFLSIPFVIKGLNWYSKGSALGTFGVLLAAWGVIGEFFS